MTPDILALKPFIPAKDFEASLSFYTALGFTARRLTPALASLELNPYGVLLQEYDVPAFAENFMMQMLVADLAAWWAHIASLDLAANFNVQPPRPPAVQPWGLTVAYVFDPTGVLWHIVQNPPA